MSRELISAILLILSTALALFASNSPLQPLYETWLGASYGGLSTQHWINDGLMAVFFLVVGLEIRHEFTHGRLNTLKKAALPAWAALGGMIGPALIYLAFTASTPAARGWGIPMATDIAFALGVLALLGKRVSPVLKVFLTALAIIDDLGAILVIAVVYTSTLDWMSLAIGIALLVAFTGVRKFHLFRSYAPIALFGAGVWFCFLHSGVHATIAGVLLACVIPQERVVPLQAKLTPLVNFLIMPIFAFANAGVSFNSTSTGLDHSTFLGVFAGLVLGKQIGIPLFAWIAVKLRLAELPDSLTWRDVYGLAWLGGIGFTMSLLIGGLAFSDPTLLQTTKTAVLSASLLSAAGGLLILSRSRRNSQISN
jgi:NhaA family Na+:H+ antiporter